MLILQTPTQIAQYRPLIDKALNEAVPPYAYSDPERNNNIFAALLRAEMQLWLAFAKVKGELRAVAMVITTIEEDACSGVRNLLIYSLYGLDIIPDGLYMTSLETLRKWAKARDCHRIVALTGNERVIQMIQAFGGDSTYRMVTIDVQ